MMANFKILAKALRCVSLYEIIMTCDVLGANVGIFFSEPRKEAHVNSVFVTPRNEHMFGLIDMFTQ